MVKESALKQAASALGKSRWEGVSDKKRSQLMKKVRKGGSKKSQAEVKQ